MALEPAVAVGAYPPGVEARRIRVRGIEQHVLVAGAGWPLVLLHGIGGSADEWFGVLPEFARHYRVVVPDAPGHGLSEKPGWFSYDSGAYARSVLGVMDALGIQRAPLVALSGGGTVALQIAFTHPDRVSRLVLVDAAGLGRQVALSYRLATLPFVEPLFRQSTTPQSIARFGRALCYAPERLPSGWVERRQHVWSTPGAVEAFFATARAGLSLWGQRVHFAPRLSRLRQPTLIIWGRQDAIIPVAHGIAAAQAIPNAQLRIFEACGHMPLWEYPEEFTQAVLDFLA